MLVLSHGDSTFVPAQIWEWDCQHGYRFACSLFPPHHAGLSVWAIVLTVAYGLIFLRLREEIERPRYSCPQCGTRDDNHSDSCSFK